MAFRNHRGPSHQDRGEEEAENGDADPESAGPVNVSDDGREELLIGRRHQRALRLLDRDGLDPFLVNLHASIYQIGVIACVLLATSPTAQATAHIHSTVPAEPLATRPADGDRLFLVVSETAHSSQRADLINYPGFPPAPSSASLRYNVARLMPNISAAFSLSPLAMARARLR